MFPPPGVKAKDVVQGLRVIGAMVLTGLTPGLTTGLTPVLPSPGLTEVCVRYSMVVGEIKESSGKVYKGVLSLKNTEIPIIQSLSSTESLVPSLAVRRFGKERDRIVYR